MVISAENFILNYFMRRWREMVSFHDLVKMKEKVEKSFDNNVYVDLYKERIAEALFLNKEYMYEKNGVIYADLKKIDSDRLEELVNESLPKDFKEKYLAILEEWEPEELEAYSWPSKKRPTSASIHRGT